ncbi:multidrug effflux MFS transporter [Sneathiella chinensis]|nr:multidrug effflux MFS transporter [Sneathiella chinensis]
MVSNSNISQTRRIPLIVLVLFSMAGPMGMNIVLPSLPTLEQVFETDYATAQLTLTLYLAAVSVGQLIYGPVSDRFGRRPVVLFGLTVFLLGGVICLFAPTIEIMIAGRVIQAMGGCAGLVIGRAMVRDLFDADTAAAMIAYLTMGIVVAPTLAPLIGGVLEDWFSWQASFVFVIAAGAVFLVASIGWAHETLPEEKRHRTNFSGMLRSFMHLLTNPEFNAYAFQVAFNTSAYFAFLGGAPYVLVNLMGGTAGELGLYLVVISVFYIGGNYMTARIAQRLGIFRMVCIGNSISLVGPVVMLVLELTVGLDKVAFFGLMSLIALGNGFTIASGMAGAVGADPERVGAAAGLAGSLQIGMGALSTFIAGLLLAQYGDTALPLIFVLLFGLAFGFLCLILGKLVADRTRALS